LWIRGFGPVPCRAVCEEADPGESSKGLARSVTPLDQKPTSQSNSISLRKRQRLIES
jgi:hypothetical protein